MVNAAKNSAKKVRELTVCALSIAGIDPGGGAGLFADMRAFHKCQVFGTGVVSLTTVQSTGGLDSVKVVSTEHVIQQALAVINHQNVRAIKTGALGSATNVKAVAELLRELTGIPYVVDPVMVATKGDAQLLDKAALKALREQLIPGATLVTPNVSEAEAIVGLSISNLDDAIGAGHAICEMGANAALMTGGHMKGKDCVDVVVFDDGTVMELRTPRLPLRKTLHGAGCTLSALITGRLARGEGLMPAVKWSKRALQAALEAPLDVGGALRVLAL